MAGIVILNLVLAVLIVTAIVGLCTWGIVADLRHQRGEPSARSAGPVALRRIAPRRAEQAESEERLDSAA